MDDIRGSLSKMKKKFKHRLPGRKRKPDGSVANPEEDSERADSTSSLPQQEPRVIAGESYDRGGDGADTPGEQVPSMDRPPQPESAPACGGDSGQEEEEADIDGREANQRHPHLHPDSEIGVGSGSSQEVEWFSLAGSTPSLSLRGREPDSTWA